MAFDNFLIEVGLYGSPFQWSYDDFGQLASDSTWFQDLWCLTHAFSADVSFRDEDMVRGVRENDRSLMSEFHRIGYSGKELASLNIVRHYRNLFHLSDISKCDGVTLDEFSVSDFSEKKSTHHVFPTCSRKNNLPVPIFAYGRTLFPAYAQGHQSSPVIWDRFFAFLILPASGSPMLLERHCTESRREY